MTQDGFHYHTSNDEQGMSAFLTRFQTPIVASSRLATDKVRMTEAGKAAFNGVTGTKTVTEIQRESADADPAQRRFSVFQTVEDVE